MLIISFLAFTCGLYIILNDRFFSDSNLKVPEEDLTARAVWPSEFPVRIKIPSIDVDAPVVPVGRTNAGAMDVPKKPMDTGWYRLGPKPGEKGSAVIAGHRGFRSGPAVFDNLHKIKIGDKVYTEDEKGRELVFVVRDISTYKATDQVPDIWEKNDVAHLNLITCFGRWNRLTRTSDERLVVFTDLVT